MKILTIADVPSKYLWDFYEPGKLKDYDLILSAGDLPSSYLTFLETMANVPLLYIHGNHDKHYHDRPPEGCECIDDRIVKVNGLRIMGLGGSMLYTGGAYQYTDKEMEARIKKMRLKIWMMGGVDIVLTHSPAKGINDQSDMPHRGFKSFLNMMDKYKPQYMVHGHVHMDYGMHMNRETMYKETKIVNAFDRFELDVEPGEPSWNWKK